MTIELELIADDNVPIEVRGLIPSAVAGGVAEVARMMVHHGNRQRPLGELFNVRKTAGDEMTIAWHGNLIGVHGIGAGMDTGTIVVTGHAGRHVGSRMTGGRIQVEGSAGDWLGAELQGGSIDVAGDAGDRVGAGYWGCDQGMTGGVIRVRGNAGNEIGHTMRRGLIAIGGSAGDMVGINMLAGTIVVAGRSGVRPGAGMRRGTLVFLHREAPELLATFRPAGQFQPLVLRLLGRSLLAADFPQARPMLDHRFTLYHGDLVTGGRGEVFAIAPDLA